MSREWASNQENVNVKTDCFLDKKLALNCVDVVCDEMGKILFWDEKRVEKEKFECKEYVNNYF